MSKTAENAIVIIVMIAILAGLLYFVGYDNIEDWLSKPFFWKSYEDVTVEPFYTKQVSEDDLTINFLIHNRTSETIEEYDFLVYIDGLEIRLDTDYMYEAIPPRDTGSKLITFSKSEYTAFGDIAVDEATYEKLLRTKAQDLQPVVRTVYLKGEDDVLIKNNGTWKIITILALSLVLGLMGLNSKFPVWMRIILKICALPIAIVLLVLFLMAQSKNGTNDTPAAGNSGSNDSRYKDAQQRYNQAARLKAGAINTGNTHSAAKAQEQMDKAMADMILASGSGSPSARDAAARYKREANLKAGAAMTGRPADAAKSQANMDRALAEMLKNK